MQNTLSAIVEMVSAPYEPTSEEVEEQHALREQFVEKGFLDINISNTYSQCQ